MTGAVQLVSSSSCAKAHHMAVDGLIHRLKHSCEEQRNVLLLISGGESMSIAVQALGQLTADHLAFITVAQTEEKFGSKGPSHWLQFISSFGGVKYLRRVLPILQEGNSLSETINNYDLELTTQIKESEYSIAVIDIDADGGIAGMRPGPAHDFQRFFNDDFVSGYETDDGGCVTITDYGLKVLSDIMVYACGPEKEQALADMKKHKPVHTHPAQLLKVYDRVTLYATEK